MKRPRREPRANAPSMPLSRPFDVDSQKSYPVDVEVIATAAECAAVARYLDLPAVRNLDGRLRLSRKAGLYELTGTLNARVERICVVSLEAFDSDISEPVRAIFAPESGPMGAGARFSFSDDDPPEPLAEQRSRARCRLRL